MPGTALLTAMPDSPFPTSGGAAPPELQTAISQFNRGQYFACHETLEDLWLDERSQLRLFYQGVLLVGIGLLHLQRRNEPGGRGVLERGCRQLLAFAPVCMGVDVERLVRESQAVLQVLAVEGLESTLARAGQLFPQIYSPPGG